jgi:hypothetical protein
MPSSRADDLQPDTIVALCCAGGLDEVTVRHPMSRWQAEAVAAALSRSLPGVRYWIEELSSIPSQGHVHRFRSVRHDGH